jgi:hypothetical protein
VSAPSVLGRPPLYDLGVGVYEQRREAAIRMLRAANPRPVSIDDLKAAGIDAPGGVIYELELAGQPVERVHHHGRLVGFRLAAVPEPPPVDRRRRRR